MVLKSVHFIEKKTGHTFFVCPTSKVLTSQCFNLMTLRKIPLPFLKLKNRTNHTRCNRNRQQKSQNFETQLFVMLHFEEYNNSDSGTGTQPGDNGGKRKDAFQIELCKHNGCCTVRNQADDGGENRLEQRI